MFKCKDSRYYRSIQSQRWRELRMRKLNNQPACEICLQAGIYTPATEVHHIHPAELAISDAEFNSLMFGWNNLQSLCHTCHAEEHRNMHSHSADAIRQRQQSRTERFINKFFGAASPEEEGGSIFFEGHPAPNHLPECREKFWGFENSVGESHFLPGGQTDKLQQL